MFANEGIHAPLRWFSQISEIIHISCHKLSWNYQLHSLPVSPNPVLLLYSVLTRVCLLLNLYYGCQHAGVSVAVLSYRVYVYSSCATLIPACGFIVIACVRAFMLARSFIRNRPTGSLRIQQNIPCLVPTCVHAGIRLLKLQRQVAPAPWYPIKFLSKLTIPLESFAEFQRVSSQRTLHVTLDAHNHTFTYTHTYTIIIHVSAYWESE